MRRSRRSLWKPQPWEDGPEPSPNDNLVDSDSEEEDFPDESTTTLGDSILKGMKKLVDAELLCDVTLIVEEERFPCHRLALAALSPYFRAMFTSRLVESRLNEIQLKEVRASTMKSIIQFVYTGEAGLNLDTAEDLFVAANRLQVIDLEDLCARFLFEHLSVDNCLGMHSLARSHNNNLLLRASLRLVAQHFPLVARQRDFLHLDPGTLASLLGSDRLGVDCEGEVYDAARRWAEHNLRERKPLMPELLANLRPGLLSIEEAKRLTQELGPWAPKKGTGGPLKPREGMFEKKIICIDLKPRDDETPELMNRGDLPVDCFDPRTGKWEKLAALDTRLGRSCSVVEGRLFVAGGILPTGTVSSSVHEYDPVSNRWMERSPMLSPRAMHGMLGCGNKLYALGGCNRAAMLESCETMDVDKLCWQPGPQLPLPLRSFACTTLRKKLYLMGGTTLEHKRAVVHAAVLIYHTTNDSWSCMQLDSGGTCLGGAVVARGGVCTIGGYMRDGTRFADENYTNLAPVEATGRVRFFKGGQGTGVEREFMGPIMPTRGTTGGANPIVFPGLPRRLAAGGVARWKRRIYLLGGENGSKVYDNIFCWKPGWTSWVKRREKLPPDVGSASQFGCATLKFPKPNILTRLQAQMQEEEEMDTQT